VDIFGMSCHTGTHLDGLGHFAKHLCLHGGTPAAEGQSKTAGLTTLGAERIAPRLGRGILLDIPAVQGAEMLAPTQVVGPKDLETAAKAARLTIQAGDVVLIRTGWMRLWPDQRKYYSVQTGQPGINLERVWGATISPWRSCHPRTTPTPCTSTAWSKRGSICWRWRTWRN
jgi:kynurenine formamidase